MFVWVVVMDIKVVLLLLVILLGLGVVIETVGLLNRIPLIYYFCGFVVLWEPSVGILLSLAILIYRL